MTDRNRVMVAMREIGVDLRRGADPELSGQIRAGGGPRLDAVLSGACERAGIARTEYDAAIAADAELGELHRKSLDDACCGATDPGPYDVFSPRDPPGSSDRFIEKNKARTG